MFSAAISQTPTWVFVIFAYVLYVGIKGLGTRVAPIWKLAVVPFIFAVLGVHGLVHMVGDEPLAWAMFGISLLVGGLAGWKISKTGIVEPLPGKQVKLSGSPVTLILVLLIFASKYALGFWMATGTAVAQSVPFMLTDAGVTGLVIGMFLGRYLGILRRCGMLGAA